MQEELLLYKEMRSFSGAINHLIFLGIFIFIVYGSNSLSYNFIGISYYYFMVAAIISFIFNIFAIIIYNNKIKLYYYIDFVETIINLSVFSVIPSIIIGQFKMPLWIFHITLLFFANNTVKKYRGWALFYGIMAPIFIGLFEFYMKGSWESLLEYMLVTLTALVAVGYLFDLNENIEKVSRELQEQEKTVKKLMHEKELQETEKQYSDFFINFIEKLQIGIILKDINNKIVFVNPFIKNLLNEIKKENSIKNYEEIIDVLIDKKILTINDDIILAFFDYPLDGNILIDNRQSNIKKVEVIINISQLEDFYETQNKDFTAKRILENISTIESYISTTAHEVNNIIQFLSLNLSLLKDSFIDFKVSNRDEVLELISPMKDSIYSINKLIVQLRNDVIKKGMSFEENVIDITKIILSISSIIKRELYAENIKLNLFIEGELYTLGDEYLFKQIFINLIINAKRAIMEKDNEKKYISIYAYSNNEKKIIIEVEDNGIGISKQNIYRIFDMNFSTKKRGEQLEKGIGLHKVKTGITAMGGEIKVDSTPGTGTVFTIILNRLSDSKIDDKRLFLPRLWLLTDVEDVKKLRMNADRCKKLFVSHIFNDITKIKQALFDFDYCDIFLVKSTFRHKQEFISFVESFYPYLTDRIIIYGEEKDITKYPVVKEQYTYEDIKPFLKNNKIIERKNRSLNT